MGKYSEKDIVKGKKITKNGLLMGYVQVAPNKLAYRIIKKVDATGAHKNKSKRKTTGKTQTQTQTQTNARFSQRGKVTASLAHKKTQAKKTSKKSQKGGRSMVREKSVASPTTAQSTLQQGTRQNSQDGGTKDLVTLSDAVHILRKYYEETFSHAN